MGSSSIFNNREHKQVDFKGVLIIKMAKDCCWNCKYYIVKGDNEPAILSSVYSNVCVFSEEEYDSREWTEKASPTPPGYKCSNYKERFY